MHIIAIAGRVTLAIVAISLVSVLLAVEAVSRDESSF